MTAFPVEAFAPAESTRKTRHRTGAGARINADSIILYRLVLAGVILTALAAFAVSWTGLLAVGGWFLPTTIAWIVPVMIDLPIAVMTLGLLGRRSRGESVLLMSIAAYGLTAVSAAANLLHIAESMPLNTIRGGFSGFLAALAPMLVLLTSEILGALITKPPRAEREDLKAQVKSLEKANRALERKVRKADAE